jgi:hypothetical protein
MVADALVYHPSVAHYLKFVATTGMVSFSSSYFNVYNRSYLPSPPPDLSCTRILLHLSSLSSLPIKLCTHHNIMMNTH